METKRFVVKTQYSNKTNEFRQSIYPWTPTIAAKDGVRECTYEEMLAVHRGEKVPAKLPEKAQDGRVTLFVPVELVDKIREMIDRWENTKNTVVPFEEEKQAINPESFMPEDIGVDGIPSLPPIRISRDISEGTGMKENFGKASDEDEVREASFEIRQIQKAKSKNDLEAFAEKNLPGFVVDRNTPMHELRAAMEAEYRERMDKVQ